MDLLDYLMDHGSIMLKIDRHIKNQEGIHQRVIKIAVFT